MTKGKLYLIPIPIAEDSLAVIPDQVIETLKPLKHFLVEDIRTARRYLSSLKIFQSIESLHFQVLNKDTKEAELPELLKFLDEGDSVGVISESGCPGVADPGALAARYAHQNNIVVVPLVGPSSILLALMASGLNGQQFSFNGYLPIESKDAALKIQELERESKLKNQTQIFIETPYRNNSVFDHFVKNLHSETQLTIAIGITGKTESIKTRKIRDWKNEKITWPKSPAVFLFLA
jgi:16S rRNA (cytidine1402-2'-O)-methyltransferase